MSISTVIQLLLFASEQVDLLSWDFMCLNDQWFVLSFIINEFVRSLLRIPLNVNSNMASKTISSRPVNDQQKFFIDFYRTIRWSMWSIFFPTNNFNHFHSNKPLNNDQHQMSSLLSEFHWFSPSFPLLIVCFSSSTRFTEHFSSEFPLFTGEKFSSQSSYQENFSFSSEWSLIESDSKVFTVLCHIEIFKNDQILETKDDESWKNNHEDAWHSITF